MTPNSFSHAGRGGLLCPWAYSQAILGFRHLIRVPRKMESSDTAIPFRNPASGAHPRPGIRKLLFSPSGSCPADRPLAPEAHHHLPAMGRAGAIREPTKKAAETAAFDPEQALPEERVGIHQEARRLRYSSSDRTSCISISFATSSSSWFAYGLDR